MCRNINLCNEVTIVDYLLDLFFDYCYNELKNSHNQNVLILPLWSLYHSCFMHSTFVLFLLNYFWNIVTCFVKNTTKNCAVFYEENINLKEKVLQFLYNFWCFLFKSFYAFNLRLRNLANKNKVLNLLCAFIDMGTFVRRWCLDGCNHSST